MQYIATSSSAYFQFSSKYVCETNNLISGKMWNFYCSYFCNFPSSVKLRTSANVGFIEHSVIVYPHEPSNMQPISKSCNLQPCLHTGKAAVCNSTFNTCSTKIWLMKKSLLYSLVLLASYIINPYKVAMSNHDCTQAHASVCN